ncbi:hypothetical protein LI968_03535 [Campylobacter jejuni]|uniref:hypothetical protein n=1 Tax=Campylobacter jejuni TaxID=197 RepID=UPI002F969328
MFLIWINLKFSMKVLWIYLNKEVQKMLGLKPKDATKLNYDNLGEIINEMKQTYFDTNSMSYGKIADLIKIWA